MCTRGQGRQMFSQVSFLMSIKQKQSKHQVMEKQINNKTEPQEENIYGAVLTHEANVYELMWTTYARHK